MGCEICSSGPETVGRMEIRAEPEKDPLYWQVVVSLPHGPMGDRVVIYSVDNEHEAKKTVLMLAAMIRQVADEAKNGLTFPLP